MKPMKILLGVLVVQAATMSGALAELEVLEVYRNLEAMSWETGNPGGAVIEADLNLGLGEYDGAVQTLFSSGTGDAAQVSSVDVDGEVISCSGSLFTQFGVSNPEDLLVGNILSGLQVDISTTGAFVVQGTVGYEGPDDQSSMFVVKEQGSGPWLTMEHITTDVSEIELHSGDVTGDFTIQLYIVLHLEDMEPGTVPATMDFSFTIAPENAVSLDNATWDGLKALFR